MNVNIVPKSCKECELKVSIEIGNCSWGEYICPFDNDLLCEYGDVSNKYNSLHGGTRHPHCQLEEGIFLTKQDATELLKALNRLIKIAKKGYHPVREKDTVEFIANKLHKALDWSDK